jgi:hypothetical protein
VTDILNMQMIMVEPFALSFGGAAPSYTISRGTGGNNLIEHDPREVWLDNGAAGSYVIDLDLGAITDWDTLSLVNVESATAATWQITGGNTPLAGTYLLTTPLRMASEDGVVLNGHALFWSPVILSGRYIRITCTPNGDPINSIGVLVVGKSFKPSKPREQGAGRVPKDTGARTEIDNGGIGTVSGFLKTGYKWVFGDLDPADLRKLWGMFKRLRTTEPFLLVEDPSEGYSDGVHWCTFIDLEGYERNDASKSRWAMYVGER